MLKHNYVFSDQLLRYRTGRALKTMKSLPNFEKEFHKFVREECRLEADNILKKKDPPLSEFSLKTLRDFHYNCELEKFENVAPTLMASIAGSISSSKDEPLSDLKRRG